MSSRKTLAQRVQALEDWMLVAQDQPGQPEDPELAEAARKLEHHIATDCAINAHRCQLLIEKELQKDVISTLRVRNLAIAYSALRNS